MEFTACGCCVSGSAAEPMAGGSRAVHFTGAREQREEGATVKIQSLDGVLVGFQGDLTGTVLHLPIVTQVLNASAD